VPTSYPCMCACKCCRGEITVREAMQSINRCLKCRRQPGDACRRIQRYDARYIPVVPWRKWAKDPDALPTTAAETKRIEAKLARLAAQRKAKRFQLGSAGVTGTSAITPTVRERP
jgi:hypothetical protein